MSARSLFANIGLATLLLSGPAVAETVWHIKCLAPHGETLAVKAFEADGSTFDIKAMPQS